jgi:hypothetical protein
MRLAIAGYVLAVVGVLCFLAVRWTHSGIGSCGPYGPAGSLAFIGMALLPIGVMLIVAYWIGRAVAYFRN